MVIRCLVGLLRRVNASSTGRGAWRGWIVTTFLFSFFFCSGSHSPSFVVKSIWSIVDCDSFLSFWMRVLTGKQRPRFSPSAMHGLTRTLASLFESGAITHAPARSPYATIRPLDHTSSFSLSLPLSLLLHPSSPLKTPRRLVFPPLRTSRTSAVSSQSSDSSSSWSRGFAMPDRRPLLLPRVGHRRRERHLQRRVRVRVPLGSRPGVFSGRLLSGPGGGLEGGAAVSVVVPASRLKTLRKPAR